MLVCEVCFVQNLKSDFLKNFYTKKSTNPILIKDSFYANCALVKLQKRFSKQCRKIAFCYFRRFRGCPYDPISALKMHLIRWFFFGLNGPFNRSFSTRFNVVQSTKETKILIKNWILFHCFLLTYKYIKRCFWVRKSILKQWNYVNDFHILRLKFGAKIHLIYR